MEKFRKNFTFIGKIKSFKQVENELIFEASHKFIKIIILSNKMFRIRMGDSENFAFDFSYSIIKTKWEKIPIKVKETDIAIIIQTQELKIIVEKSPYRLIVKNNDDQIIWEDINSSAIGWKDNEIIYIKKMPEDEHYYGFGEKTGGLDKRGYSYRMHTKESPFYQTKTDPLYQAHPYFIGLRKNNAYGVFFDNTWETFFDMGKGFKDFYIIGAKNGELNLYFFYGPTIKEVIEQYTELIGRIMLPPIWSLGFVQCRWGYKDAKKVNEIASKLRENKISSDMLVLDLDYMKGKRVFTWNDETFPDPENWTKIMNEKGFKLITIIDPGVKVEDGYYMHDEGVKNDYFVKKTDDGFWHGYVWPGKTYFPDYTKEEVRKWWGEKVEFLLNKGISGIWNDMNEISYNIQPYLHRVKTKNTIFYDNGLNTSYEKNHNVYGLLMAKATHEGLLKCQPNKRPWILTRSGFPGIHRYAAVWTGDNTSNWQHMKMSIPMLCNMGLSAIPNVGADIGGFSPWINCLRKLVMRLDKNFATRWHQLGAFYPFARNHCVIFARPQEPWEFGEEALEIIKKYILLRYHWIPYLYNLFVECSKNGLPPMRPLILEFQDDEICYNIDDQFMWGEHILVAPVIKKNLKLHKIYLPEGIWFDYWSGERHHGKIIKSLPVDWHEIPILIRAGAIIPCQPDMEYFREKEINPLILEVYPDFNLESEYTFQEDDGESLEYLREKICTTQYILSCKNGDIEFIIGARKGQFKPNTRDYLILFKFIGTVKNIELDGTSLEKASDENLNKWYLDERTNDIIIKIQDTGEKRIIKINK
ncbi:MAG: DUF4968 domain-containing protein [Candidatus Lokiarchaeota archaeon]|nr:DUF4968 domain-containing protein [Candidatus Lokiarchaeota archaeon]